MPMSQDEQQEAIRRAIEAIQSGSAGQAAGSIAGQNMPSGQAQQPILPNPVLNALPSDKPPSSYGNAPTTSQAITGALQGAEQKKQLEDLFRSTRE